MRFAKWVFTIAGIYGLITVAPLYGLENIITRATGPITYPEYFYGFIGVTVAFQILFLLIGRNPAQLRGAIPACLVEKVSFPAAAWPLFLMGRIATPVVVLASIDLVWAVLFFISWRKTRAPAPGRQTSQER